MTPPNLITTYVNRVTTVKCTPNKLWTVDQMSWIVSGCQKTPSEAYGEEQIGCRFSSDQIIDGATLQVTFDASFMWNGAEIACAAVGPPIGQRSSIKVQVNGRSRLQVVL